MAEAWTNHLKGDQWQAFSAGSAPSGVDPLTVEAMGKAGVDISEARSKSMDEFRDQSFDYIVTLCDNARAACPMFPGEGARIHRGFEDPPLLATYAQTRVEALAHYIRVRDQIREMIQGLPNSLEE
jgi:arsenate reductase